MTYDRLPRVPVLDKLEIIIQYTHMSIAFHYPGHRTASFHVSRSVTPSYGRQVTLPVRWQVVLGARPSIEQRTYLTTHCGNIARATIVSCYMKWSYRSWSLRKFKEEKAWSSMNEYIGILIISVCESHGSCAIFNYTKCS